MSNNNTNSGGIGFTGALAIVFIVLKLTDNIDWSWWWVLSPLWIGLVVVVPLVLFLFWANARRETREAAAENEFFRRNPHAKRLDYAMKRLRDDD